MSIRSNKVYSSLERCLVLTINLIELKLVKQSSGCAYEDIVRTTRSRGLWPHQWINPLTDLHPWEVVRHRKQNLVGGLRPLEAYIRDDQALASSPSSASCPPYELLCSVIFPLSTIDSHITLWCRIISPFMLCLRYQQKSTHQGKNGKLGPAPDGAS